MKRLTDFKHITERQIVSVTHYCVKNAKDEDVEVTKGSHDYEVTDNFRWYKLDRIPNETNALIKSAEQQFTEFVRDNLDSVMSGEYMSEDNILPEANAEFLKIKQFCKNEGTTVDKEFPILLSKMSKIGSNYQSKKRKWLQYLHSWSVFPLFDKELKLKIMSYGY